ncbi:hypothetical protein [Paenibacillus sp. FSL H8-0537]|uniref:hypothetical protein n=1 Tax=Paenibacillus sp. FSL H8-0537 TaxID=2921399 RepID=UPI00310150DE
MEPKTLSLIPEFHKLIATSIDYNTLGNRKVRISLKDLSNRLNKLNEQSDLKKNWLRTYRWWGKVTVQLPEAKSLELIGNGHPYDKLHLIDKILNSEA